MQVNLLSGPPSPASRVPQSSEAALCTFFHSFSLSLSLSLRRGLQLAPGAGRPLGPGFPPLQPGLQAPSRALLWSLEPPSRGLLASASPMPWTTQQTQVREVGVQLRSVREAQGELLLRACHVPRGVWSAMCSARTKESWHTGETCSPTTGTWPTPCLVAAARDPFFWPTISALAGPTIVSAVCFRTTSAE